MMSLGFIVSFKLWDIVCKWRENELPTPAGVADSLR